MCTYLLLSAFVTTQDWKEFIKECVLIRLLAAEIGSSSELMATQKSKKLVQNNIEKFEAVNMKICSRCVKTQSSAPESPYFVLH